MDPLYFELWYYEHPWNLLPQHLGWCLVNTRVTEYYLLKGMLSIECRSISWVVLFRMSSTNQHRKKDGSLIPQHISPCTKGVWSYACVKILLLSSQPSKGMRKVYSILAPIWRIIFPGCSLYLPLRKREIIWMLCLLIQCVECSCRLLQIIICHWGINLMRGGAQRFYSIWP